MREETTVYAVVLHWRVDGVEQSSVKQPLYRELERAMRGLDEWRSVMVPGGYWWSLEELDVA